MQIIIYRVTLLCLFQHKSRQSYHSNHLKVGRIAVTPQTRNPHERSSLGQPFGPYNLRSNDQCSFEPSVQLRYSYSQECEAWEILSSRGFRSGSSLQEVFRLHYHRSDSELNLSPTTALCKMIRLSGVFRKSSMGDNRVHQKTVISCSNLLGCSKCSNRNSK